jgi:hypothetical protein
MRLLFLSLLGSFPAHELHSRLARDPHGWALVSPLVPLSAHTSKVRPSALAEKDSGQNLMILVGHPARFYYTSADLV